MQARARHLLQVPQRASRSTILDPIDQFLLMWDFELGVRLLRKRMNVLQHSIQNQRVQLNDELEPPFELHPFLARLSRNARELPYAAQEKRAIVERIANLDGWIRYDGFDFWRDKECPAMEDYLLANLN